ncbi:hypothetical protein K8R04_05120 [Candidatus Uhrbacteria bacterium]|nr:hypothetical protein [Candidatus Uhrbacteria bacterium]
MGFLPMPVKVVEMDDATVQVDVGGQPLSIPRSMIAGNPVKGDTLQLVAIAPGKQQDTDQEVARAMLNRLLGEGATAA